MAELVRITTVGGRYLVFEVKDVAALRRDHCICAVLVGTTAQNPTQNLFSGLPLELLPEEARLLVDKGAAYIVDDATSLLTHLSTMDPSARHAYLQSLRTRRKIIQRALDEEASARALEGAKKRAKQKSKRASAKEIPIELGFTDHEESLFASPLSAQKEVETPSSSAEFIPSKLRHHITPTTSIDMLLDPKAHSVSIETPRSYPLYAHLNSKGYYITPGIRFGADYSVYPGDPFRYHAHFMATSYDWEEETTILDLVSGGRLGTGVKKGFLIGGQAPPRDSAQGKEQSGGDRVRAFTIEWAAM